MKISASNSAGWTWDSLHISFIVISSLIIVLSVYLIIFLIANFKKQRREVHTVWRTPEGLMLDGKRIISEAELLSMVKAKKTVFYKNKQVRYKNENGVDILNLSLIDSAQPDVMAPQVITNPDGYARPANKPITSKYYQYVKFNEEEAGK